MANQSIRSGVAPSAVFRNRDIFPSRDREGAGCWVLRPVSDATTPFYEAGSVKRACDYALDGVNLLFGFAPADQAAPWRPIRLFDDAHSYGRA